jgi:hypothetical protein
MSLPFAGSVMRQQLLVCVLMGCSYAAAQIDASSSGCGTSEAVLQRYVDAIGGEAAVNQVRTLVIEAHASEPHTFNPQSTAHYQYRFKWRYPNQVAVKRRYLLQTATSIFDGTAWSNFDGKVSHNEDATPLWRRELMAGYPYNDYPSFLMYRVAANPILLATTQNLYSSYETLPSTEGMCVLQAIGKNEWGRERRDKLFFDAKSGLLKTWAIQMGVPDAIYVHFEFDDYQQSGDVNVPWSIYFDFYKTALRLTKVVPYAVLSDAAFVAKQ